MFYPIRLQAHKLLFANKEFSKKSKRSDLSNPHYYSKQFIKKKEEISKELKIFIKILFLTQIFLNYHKLNRSETMMLSIRL